MADPILRSKLVTLICGTAIGVALVGLLVGSGAARPGWEAPVVPCPVTETEVKPAVVYADMNGKARGPNAAYRSDLRTLASRPPGVLDPVVQSAADKQAALAKRASRRAYNGAPPIIPHVVDGNDVASCYQCHGEGKVIDSVVAPRISHQRYTNCTQCHAQGATPTPGDVPDFAVANLFQGAASPSKGVRAYPGAPPQIPHHTAMRENCTSCHGVTGLTGIRSTHPWRANCLQCHAPSASLDQRHFEEPPPAPWETPTADKQP